MELTPKQIIAELDKYIIGQEDAKKMVAISLRNRYRRSQLSDEIREEITPKNIIMKGPTGVGKTEIARRLAKLVKAPFIKVEATKFTEVGYVGRDVESMIRDLVESAIRLVKEERYQEVKPKATEIASQRLAKAILPLRKEASPDTSDNQLLEEISHDLAEGKLDDLQVTLDFVEQPKPLQMETNGQGASINIGNIFQQMGMAQGKKVKRKMPVKDAMKALISEASDKMIDQDTINLEALRRAEQEGIIFIDEIDKIASNNMSHGIDVSREGVQRDILPIVEGCTVSTKYGNIRTDFILFIAAGAFHIAEVKDLIPELQGRFPVIVELESLSKKDFVRIMTEPDNAILKMYSILLKTDGVNLTFTDDAVDALAEIAEFQNANSENLGARRLHALVEKLLEEISFEANGMPLDVIVDKTYVESHVGQDMRSLDLKKYIL